MIGELSNHLWQSTVFVALAALLAAALRKNRAHIRHAVWVTASLKFFVPFSLLLALGSQWAWTRSASRAAARAARVKPRSIRGIAGRSHGRRRRFATTPSPYAIP